MSEHCVSVGEVLHHQSLHFKLVFLDISSKAVLDAAVKSVVHSFVPQKDKSWSFASSLLSLCSILIHSAEFSHPFTWYCFSFRGGSDGDKPTQHSCCSVFCFGVMHHLIWQ